MATRSTVKTFQTRQSYVAYCHWYNDAVLKTHGANIYIEYVREPELDPTKRGKPFGVLVAFKGDDGLISLGWAVARGPKKDETGAVVRKAETFDKAIGLCKAMRRAWEEDADSGVMPFRLTNDSSLIDGFLDRAAKNFDKRIKEVPPSE